MAETIVAVFSIALVDVVAVIVLGGLIRGRAETRNARRSAELVLLEQPAETG